MSYDPNSDDEIRRISFYSPVEGYVSYGREIGFTTDSGHTFTRKPIGTSNIDFNGYDVNLTLGFLAGGVKAIDRNNVIVYGTFALVPAILRSQDGGNTFKLVFHSQYGVIPNSAVEDMVFPSGTQIGFAVDRDRILKTSDGGNSWLPVKSETDADFRYIDAVDNNTVVAISPTKAFKTLNSGSSWQSVNIPGISNNYINYIHFRTTSKGWMSLSSTDGSVFVTNDGGTTWTQQNDAIATPFRGIRLKFTDDNNGYAIGNEGIVYKTMDGGRLWEPLKRNSQIPASHRDLFFLSTQQFWAGGYKELVEMTTNGGGTTTPKAYFTFDSAQYTETGKVRLINRSKPGYAVKWLVNGTSVGTTDNVEYSRNINLPEDEISLIISNGTDSDTASITVSFPPLVIVSSFTPATAARGTQVTITGSNFRSVTSVTFGGVHAESYYVESEFIIKAIVGQGASGEVRVNTATGGGKLAGFTFLPPPNITSFSPTSARAGATITINGAEFGNATKVLFGGVEAQSFTVVSPTTITAVVPSGPSGFISVESPYGTGSLDGFISLPVITSFTPLHGTQGTIITIEGTSLSELTSVTVGGMSAQTFKIISTELVEAVVHTGATGSVTVSKTGGSSTLAGFTWYPPPVITSFSPASGAIGTTVTITGQNFDNIPSNNTVFFGDVKAVVTSATTTSLQVTVPAGATFEPISVTNHNLTAWSHYPFVVTFANGGSITPTSFDVGKVIRVNDDDILTNLLLKDFDGDGKNDLLVTGIAYTHMSVYRNISTSAEVLFDAPIDFPGPQVAIASGDLDGDGKPDIAMTMDETIEILRNTSSVGNISFQRQDPLPSEFYLYGIAIDDIDGDGKGDIAVNNGFENRVLVYRNTSNPGKIMFAEKINFDAPGGRNIILTDMDGDKKPDIILPGATAQQISVLKNQSSKGNIQFSTRVAITGYNHSYIAAGDIDGDGKTDIVSVINNDSGIAVFRNNSSGGNLAFANPLHFNTPPYPEGIATADLDGDGRLDIAVGVDKCKMGVLKNVTSGTNISFGPMVEYTQGFFKAQHLLDIGDINNDGRNDVVAIDENSRQVHVFVNRVLPAPYIESFTPSSGEAGTVVTITGQNFSNVTSVTFGGVAAASYTVNSSTQITATIAAGNSGDVSVTNNFGTGVKPGFVYGSPMIISSFSPARGPAGSTIIINGSNFGTTVGDNVVYFGSAKATVVSASAELLSVIVPAAATYQPITVTSGGRTAYSGTNFITTFPGAESLITTRNFKKADYNHTGAARALFDVDGDGRLDLLIPGTANQIFISINQTTAGNLSYGNNQSFAHAGQATSFATGDLNGDGRKDIVAANYANNSISLWINNSSPGNLVLSTATELQTGNGQTNPSAVAINDIDGDGKPDIVVSNYTSKTVSIFRNISVGNDVQFDTRKDILLSGSPSGLVVNDMNADHRPELIVSVIDIDRVLILANTSVTGAVSFNTAVEFPESSPELISCGDFNVDGKPDLLFSTTLGWISMLINQSTQNNISFKRQMVYQSGDLQSLSSADLDGDGKPDVVSTNPVSDYIIFAKNNGLTPEGFVSTSQVDIRNEIGSPRYTSIGDINGDAMPDIAIDNGGTLTTFFTNTTNITDTLSVCPESDTSLMANVPGSSYRWQRNTGNGFLDIADDANISGSHTEKLMLRNINSMWDGYAFRCITDGTVVNREFVIRLKSVPQPEVSIVGSDTTICIGARVTFTAASANEGTIYGYIWKVNGALHSAGPVLSFDAFITDSLVIQLLMVTNATCAISDTVASNTVVVRQYPRDTLGVQISGITNVVRGQSALIVATAHQTRLPVTYQWQDSTKSNGWNNIDGQTGTSINYKPVNTGDKLRCVITGNVPCETEEVWSNVLQFTVGEPAVVTSELITNNPVSNGVLVIDSIKLADKWETLEITNANTGQKQLLQSISGQTSLRVFVGNLSNGVYVAVLRGRSRTPIHFKFLKM